MKTSKNFFPFRLQTLTGMQMRQNSKSATAKLAKKMLMELFIFLYPQTETTIKVLPIRPRRKVSLKMERNAFLQFYELYSVITPYQNTDYESLLDEIYLRIF